MLSVVNLSPSSSVRRSPPTLSLPSPAALASKDWQGVTDKVVLNTEDILNTVEERQDKVGVALLLFKSAHGIFQQDGAYVKKNLKAVFFSQFTIFLQRRGPRLRPRPCIPDPQLVRWPAKRQPQQHTHARRTRRQGDSGAGTSIGRNGRWEDTDLRALEQHS